MILVGEGISQSRLKNLGLTSPWMSPPSPSEGDEIGSVRKVEAEQVKVAKELLEPLRREGTGLATSRRGDPDLARGDRRPGGGGSSRL